MKSYKNHKITDFGSEDEEEEEITKEDVIFSGDEA